MVSAAPRTWAGKTAEARAARRRAMVIDAAITVVAEHGWRRLTLERICDTAGLTKRYFYESFSTVDDIAAALVDELAAEVHAVAVPADFNAPPAELIYMMVESLVDYAIANPTRARVFFADLSGIEAASRQRVIAIRRIVDGAARDVRLIHRADDPMIDLMASLLVNGTMLTMVDWLDGRIEMSRRRFVDQLSALWLITSDGAISYLTR